jgi:hypothetical protein
MGSATEGAVPRSGPVGIGTVSTVSMARQREDDNRHALGQMERFLKADITPSNELDIPKLPR